MGWFNHPLATEGSRSSYHSYPGCASNTPVVAQCLPIFSEGLLNGKWIKLIKWIKSDQVWSSLLKWQSWSDSAENWSAQAVDWWVPRGHGKTYMELWRSWRFPEAMYHIGSHTHSPTQTYRTMVICWWFIGCIAWHWAANISHSIGKYTESFMLSLYRLSMAFWQLSIVSPLPTITDQVLSTIHRYYQPLILLSTITVDLFGSCSLQSTSTTINHALTFNV